MSGQTSLPLLEVKNPVPAEVFTFVNFLYDWTRVSSFLPPIAFGQDNGGGQRSGDTLEIRMWSMVKAIHRSRAYMTNGIRQMMQMTAAILKQKRISEVPARHESGEKGSLRFSVKGCIG